MPTLPIAPGTLRQRELAEAARIAEEALAERQRERSELDKAWDKLRKTFPAAQ